MSFSKIHSAQVAHLRPSRVDIEVDISRGLYSFSIVGLGDKAVDESKDRVCSAIKNSGYKAPKQKNEKIIISLAPAYSKKHGPLFDVAIALGYLEASGEIHIANKERRLFLGELGLDGALRPIHGILPLARYAKAKGFTEIFVPSINAREAAIVSGLRVFGAKNLLEIITHVHPQASQKISMQPSTDISSIIDKKPQVHFGEIRGQQIGKRGLLIAASGGHNTSLYGPPGTGKTLLAKAFQGIFPSISFEETLEVASIYSAAGLLEKGTLPARPFRSPHHSASYVAICGGGSNISPGEVTLSHRGILFLDELPEFDRKVIDSLRQPLEDGVICISRASGTVTYPAEFTLVATMNPCPCGYANTGIKTCRCSIHQISKYQSKVSGPIADRIDIWIEVGHIPNEELLQSSSSSIDELTKETARLQVIVGHARKIQIDRQGKLNHALQPKELEQYCPLDESCIQLLHEAAGRLDLSARAVHKVIKLGRTIADLANKKDVESDHILEALQYRKR